MSNTDSNLLVEGEAVLGDAVRNRRNYAEWFQLLEAGVLRAAATGRSPTGFPLVNYLPVAPGHKPECQLLIMLRSYSSIASILSPSMPASQVRRLLYTGSGEGTRVRSQRHLKRLTDLGLIRRLWGVYDGPAEYIYVLAGTTGRGPVFHTLDISELYVRLPERHISNGLDEADNGRIVFDGEPGVI